MIIRTKFVLFLALAVLSCAKDDPTIPDIDTPPINDDPELTAIESTFGGKIDLDNLYNYAEQAVPDYITKDNTRGNRISDLEATLGRVLFYDKKLSLTNTVACASCHQQPLAFGDNVALSRGINGNTGRHSMRLVNARFSAEDRFFWDERANTLEEQTTQPIQDHIEMGYSGENGEPGIEQLLAKLKAEAYYQELMMAVYGDQNLTEQRMQQALAQFIRSIQSFDSKYDEGRASVADDQAAFSNFTAEENRGKTLFLAPPGMGGPIGDGMMNGGLGCNACHSAPEFDIDPRSRNNGVITSASNPAMLDLNNTRSPSLRDLFNPMGELNGPMMHNGAFENLNEVLDHYTNIPNNNNNNNNNNLDPRLGRGPGQRQNLSNDDRNALIAFLQTLSGQDMYTNEKWSDPF